MATITIEVPDTAPVSVIADLAERLGCDLRMIREGEFRAIPRESSGKVISFPGKPRVLKGGVA